jgi:hypothetical protein
LKTHVYESTFYIEEICSKHHTIWTSKHNLMMMSSPHHTL